MHELVIKIEYNNMHGEKIKIIMLFACAFTDRYTALLEIHTSQEETEIHYTFMDIGDMCLIMGTQADNSPHLVPLFFF